jgi:thioredoxin-related protein
MKTKALFFVWIVCLGASVWLLFDSEQAGGWDRKPIYDESVDGSKQIADALVIAKKENKHVLLQFGANWCVWCHRLHRFFEADKAVSGKLRSDFVIVLVDVSNGHNASVVSEYGEESRSGIPAIAVLDSGGKLVASTSSADFAEDGQYSSKKILAFLNSCISK